MGLSDLGSRDPSACMFARMCACVRCHIGLPISITVSVFFVHLYVCMYVIQEIQSSCETLILCRGQRPWAVRAIAGARRLRMDHIQELRRTRQGEMSRFNLHCACSRHGLVVRGGAG
jgi:hypothetical protein